MFITFEGLDGSGKTTVISYLKEYIKQNGLENKFVFTREPGGLNSKLSEDIRAIILDNKNNIDPMSEALLYMTSRNIHVTNTIRPALNSNKIVICDRYIDSSIAYQGAGRNLGMELIEKLNLIVVNNLIPNYTFYFKVDYKTSMERMKKNRVELDRLENEKQDFFERVLDAYETLAIQKKDKYIIIDSTKPIEMVVNQVINEFKRIIKNII